MNFKNFLDKNNYQYTFKDNIFYIKEPSYFVLNDTVDLGNNELVIEAKNILFCNVSDFSNITIADNSEKITIHNNMKSLFYKQNLNFKKLPSNIKISSIDLLKNFRISVEDAIKYQDNIDWSCYNFKNFFDYLEAKSIHNHRANANI